MNGETSGGFTMLGVPDAIVCEGDACLMPGAETAAPGPTS